MYLFALDLLLEAPTLSLIFRFRDILWQKKENKRSKVVVGEVAGRDDIRKLLVRD